MAWQPPVTEDEDSDGSPPPLVYDPSDAKEPKPRRTQDRTGTSSSSSSEEDSEEDNEEDHIGAKMELTWDQVISDWVPKNTLVDPLEPSRDPCDSHEDPEKTKPVLPNTPREAPLDVPDLMWTLAAEQSAPLRRRERKRLQNHARLLKAAMAVEEATTDEEPVGVISTGIHVHGAGPKTTELPRNGDWCNTLEGRREVSDRLRELQLEVTCFLLPEPMNKLLRELHSSEELLPQDKARKQAALNVYMLWLGGELKILEDDGRAFLAEFPKNLVDHLRTTTMRLFSPGPEQPVPWGTVHSGAIGSLQRTRAGA
jgi:hypothetical protein